MTACAGKKPLWYSIEESIQKLGDVQGGESAVQEVAKELDISLIGGSMLELRWALDAAAKAGRPFLKDLDEAVGALTLDDVVCTRSAAAKLVGELGKTWPDFRKSERKADLIRMLEEKKLDLLVAKAKTLPGDKGIRLLIEESVAREDVLSGLGIDEARLKEVETLVEKERAERARVQALIDEAGGKPPEEKVKHLIQKDVAEALIIEMAGVDSAVISKVQKAMEEEIKEKERLAAEEAARKAKEAAGPSLDEIPNDTMLEYIESIREILEFSTEEKEIRVMCGQSSIPASLVDVVVASPDKLDELEKKAGG